MNSLSKPDTEVGKRFRQQLKRDIFLLLVIAAFTAIAIVFTLYYSVKYGW